MSLGCRALYSLASFWRLLENQFLILSYRLQHHSVTVDNLYVASSVPVEVQGELRDPSLVWVWCDLVKYQTKDLALMIRRRCLAGAIFGVNVLSFSFKLFDSGRSSNPFKLLPHEVGILGNFFILIRERTEPT